MELVPLKPSVFWENLMEGQRNKSTKDVFKGAEVGIDHEIDGR